MTRSYARNDMTGVRALQAEITRLNQALSDTERTHRRTLQQIESRYAAVVRASGQLLYDWDPNTNAVTYANVQPVLGYEDSDMSGGLAHWMSLIHPDDRRHFETEINRVIATKASFKLSYRVRKKDGRYITTDDRGYFFLDGNGDIVRMVGFVIDVTDRRKLEDQLQQAQKMEAIALLAGGIAHDFNNILTVILGYSDASLNGLPSGSPVKRNLEQIHGAGERAAALTQQLLAFSRRQVLQPRVLDLNDVIHRMKTLLRRLIGENIRLETRLAGSLDRLRADPSQIEQIVMNLAVNARDAMPAGGSLTIETANLNVNPGMIPCHGEIEPGPHVMLKISDTGTGMDDETRKRAFEPFFTTKEQGKGTGLGLSTVYGIVRQSFGALCVETAPGKGTSISAVFPRTHGSPDVPAASSHAASTVASARVIVVEDEESVRELIKSTLEAAGCNVRSAADPDEARRLFDDAGAPPDLLLTDMVLPTESGKVLARELRAKHPDLRLIFMSGYAAEADGEDEEIFSEAGIIQKPFTQKGLIETVQVSLSRRNSIHR